MKKAADFWRDFGARVRAARRLCGISQPEFGRLIGWKRVHISNIERGRAGIRLPDLGRIAEALDCAVVNLLPESWFPPEVR